MLHDDWEKAKRCSGGVWVKGVPGPAPVWRIEGPKRGDSGRPSLGGRRGPGGGGSLPGEELWRRGERLLQRRNFAA